MRGRTEPEEAGRAEADALLPLADDELEALPEGLDVAEGLLPEEGLLPDDGLPPDVGLLPDAGFAVVEGELADGAGLSAAGGGVAWATGSPPPPEERL